MAQIKNYSQNYTKILLLYKNVNTKMAGKAKSQAFIY